MNLLSINSELNQFVFIYSTVLSLEKSVYRYAFIYYEMQYKYMNIVEDSKVNQMFIRKNLSEKRKNHYEVTLNELYQMTGKTPSELINEAKEEQKPYLDNNQIIFKDIEDRKITEYFYNYYQFLRNRELANNTINTKLTTFRAFYNEYDVELPKNIKLDLTTKILREGDIPNIDDIRRAVENATSLRNKAIITFMASTGISSGDVRTFKVSDFTRATEKYHNGDSIEDLLDDKQIKDVIPCWYFKPEKTKKVGNICMTFNTPETSDLIIEYLKNRNDLREDDCLFLSQYREGLQPSGVINLYKELNDKLFGRNEDAKRFFHAHAMRKFFKSTIAHNSSDYNKSKILTGHSISKIDMVYEELNEDIMKQFYMLLIPHLSIKDTEVKTIKDEDFVHLEQELAQKDEKQAELESRLALTEEQNKEILALLSER